MNTLQRIINTSGLVIDNLKFIKLGKFYICFNLNNSMQKQFNSFEEVEEYINFIIDLQEQEKE